MRNLGTGRRVEQGVRGLAWLGVALVLLSACARHHEVIACNAMLALPSVRVDLRPLAEAHPTAHGRFCPHAGDRRVAERCTTFAITAAGSVTPTPGFNDPAGSIRVYLSPGDDVLVSRTWVGKSVVVSRIQLSYHRSGLPCGGLVYSPLALRPDGSLHNASEQ